ncbi:conserved hypothetical protein [Ferrimonas balearica DSM 9799]|uniref:Uncharacterized protein n=1 Tax=Ferrimonas balearica (strain DSM 9799 / CCM 4581 / KCTC 23876 / PAT) TaxID=550540 RepID=E1SPF7_FERBD|nr:hypothetical protein [Ferrimonas balearica]MBY6017260.1 hypothetical protein [Halomonas denitrificans]ADN76774.1 conserved hypothetical protein [Ferrimonas balearica DSM 9799]MBW3140240.1 hypothetical protein [Ferrimonas balearica]MBW3166249.1 hypothetical protein [Ferrimonas balearica]MBY5979876.1 hypothetical protein [Ferrimonas balearica]
MSDNISQSAPIESIAAYLKQVHGYDQARAWQEAETVVAEFKKMQRLGYIQGWYFDEQGHLDLIPSDDVLHRLGNK